MGSTGSIGTQTLKIAEDNSGFYEVEGLAVHHNTEMLARQIDRFHPCFAAITDESAGAAFRSGYRGATRLFIGENALTQLCEASRADVAVVAVVGIAGLPAVMTCLHKGMDIALANKEALVAGGSLVMELAREQGAAILPVDSEHSAVFQCLQGPHAQQEVARIILTASGGPFRGCSLAELEKVTVEDALRHPNWNMGAKITVDSATLMNKGLEVIEAHHLFGMEPEKIDVVVHPGSIVHSMVEFIDGAVLAQMGVPDMGIPIQYALTWPHRKPAGMRRLDLTACGPLVFEAPDRKSFPCLDLAYRALGMGQSACVALNAANEIAVNLFLNRRIGFSQIPHSIEWVLDTMDTMTADSLEAVMTMDREVRRRTMDYIGVKT